MSLQTHRKLLSFKPDDVMKRIDFVMELRDIWKAEYDQAASRPWMQGAQEVIGKLEAAIEVLDKLYLAFLMGDMAALKGEINDIRMDSSRDNPDDVSGDSGDVDSRTSLY